MAKDIAAGSVIMPHKKPKGIELTDSQKGENNLMSKLRVDVEKAIAGIKSFSYL